MISQKKCLLSIFSTALLLLTCITNSGVSRSTSGNNLIVVGVINELNDQRWKDYRIGFGIRTLIAQTLFNTNKFNMIEEKTEIKEKIIDLSRGIWENSKKHYNFSEDQFIIKTLEADYIAYGRIYYFGKPQTSISVGVMHRRVEETVIKVEITIENVHLGKQISSKGIGKAKTTANSILFTIREDYVVFDETSIGIATKNAVEDAVNKLIKKLSKIQ